MWIEIDPETGEEIPYEGDDTTQDEQPVTSTGSGR